MVSKSACTHSALSAAAHLSLPNLNHNTNGCCGCVPQPGVASVYCSIVQQTRSGVEFYIKGFPELEGLTYKGARRAFDKAVVCGYQEANGVLHVNPKDDVLLDSKDRIIALAQTGLIHQGACSRSVPQAVMEDSTLRPACPAWEDSRVIRICGCLPIVIH